MTNYGIEQQSDLGDDCVGMYVVRVQVREIETAGEPLG